ncbi:7465_t:CDS:1, partial [Racocetra fulgida]
PENASEEIEEIREIDTSEFITFLEEVKSDYQNADQTLRIALDKFKDRYNAAKSKSISCLTSYLYDLHRSLDPMVRIKSGSHIRVQVESIKRRKMERGSTRQKLSTSKNKENSDPHTIQLERRKKHVK